MNTENLDYHSKVVAPSQQLYQQLSTQADEFIAQAKESALELHANLAESSLEFYQHPTETATRWQTLAVNKSNEFYATLSNEIIPNLQADYQHLVSNVTEYGIQSRQSFHFFIDHPEKVTVEAFSSLNQALITFFDRSMDVSGMILDDLSLKATKIIDLLIEQPIVTMENIYYESLAALLDSYFAVVSSLITTV